MHVYGDIYIYIYKCISVSIYLCSGTTSQRKYKTEFRLRCP